MDRARRGRERDGSLCKKVRSVELARSLSLSLSGSHSFSSSLPLSLTVAHRGRPPTQCGVGGRRYDCFLIASGDKKERERRQREKASPTCFSALSFILGTVAFGFSLQGFFVLKSVLVTHGKKFTWIVMRTPDPSKAKALLRTDAPATSRNGAELEKCVCRGSGDPREGNRICRGELPARPLSFLSPLRFCDLVATAAAAVVFGSRKEAENGPFSLLLLPFSGLRVRLGDIWG